MPALGPTWRPPPPPPEPAVLCGSAPRAPQGKGSHQARHQGRILHVIDSPINVSANPDGDLNLLMSITIIIESPTDCPSPSNEMGASWPQHPPQQECEHAQGEPLVSHAQPAQRQKRCLRRSSLEGCCWVDPLSPTAIPPAVILSGPGTPLPYLPPSPRWQNLIGWCGLRCAGMPST